jgi:hypothetical protein
MKTWIVALACIACPSALSLAQTAKPSVTLNDKAVLRGQRAMSVDIQLGDRSEERVIREQVAATLKQLGIKTLPAGQPPIFRLDVDSELITSSGASSFVFHNIMTEFVMRVADPADMKKTFLAPTWRARRAELFRVLGSETLSAHVETALGTFSRAYREANPDIFPPLPRFQSTNVAGLHAADGKMVVVVGAIARIDKRNEGWYLYLEAPSNVFVLVHPGPFLDDLFRMELRGERVVGTRIAATGQVRSFGDRGVRIDLPFLRDRDAVEIVR